MKYALFEFEEENNSQLSVGESSLIIYVEAEMCNNDDFDLSEPIQVAWNDGKVYFAKVHRFSDDRPELVELMKTLLCDDDDEFSQRGRRVKRRKLSDTEEAPTQSLGATELTKARKSKKKQASEAKSQAALPAKLDQQTKERNQHMMSKKPVADVMGVPESDIVQALRNENEWLRTEVLSSLKEFPKLVGLMSSSLASCSNSLSRSPSVCSTPATPASHTSSITLESQSMESSVTVQNVQEAMAYCQVPSSARKYTNNLLATTSDNAYLASHYLTGQPSSKTSAAKPAVDSQKVGAIIKAVMEKFSDAKELEIRHWMTEKLNNAA